MSVWFASPAEDQVIYCYFSRSNQKNDPIPKKWSRRNVNTGNESQIKNTIALHCQPVISDKHQERARYKSCLVSSQRAWFLLIWGACLLVLAVWWLFLFLLLCTLTVSVSVANTHHLDFLRHSKCEHLMVLCCRTWFGYPYGSLFMQYLVSIGIRELADKEIAAVWQETLY